VKYVFPQTVKPTPKVREEPVKIDTPDSAPKLFAPPIIKPFNINLKDTDGNESDVAGT